MRPNIHTDFILSPITDILKDVVSASTGIGSGIETYPMCDYVMQSVFLKLTGFQEQKLKCVCWELATVDFEYRYDYHTKPVGERSSYSDKQALYKDLVEQIVKRTTNFNVQNDINKDNILTITTNSIKNIFEKTNLSIWSQKNFNEYGAIWSEIEKKHFANDNTNLFTATKEDEISLQRIYRNYLYKHRNRIAHNTQSYQQNLPTLKTLINIDYKYENYFIWFSTLVLIDEIFRALYVKYLNTFDDN
ncbi:hypothetical protein KO02_09585 [Sphingobacterium sp. ML3W]|uniref:hypothetical protein n=1 Tax=Sphingobacterium sp. ML3W TaxID=1538644 RepID=UPI0004F694EE|nr:hypothetical protein [Sphingobacterium sp. ML3W]AIM36916.1 hypothetical protein KO02_09585 [Sphingobacterium sp. ML3W]